MPRFLQLVQTAPVVAAEAEFNRWYDEVHVREVLTMPGFLTGQRFRLLGDDPAPQPRYLAAYEVESDDIAATLRMVRDTAPARTKSPAIDTGLSLVRWYEALGPRSTTD
jgi:hypothetical protein